MNSVPWQLVHATFGETGDEDRPGKIEGDTNIGRGHKKIMLTFSGAAKVMGSLVGELTLPSNSPVSLGHQRGFRGSEMHMLGETAAECVW